MSGESEGGWLLAYGLDVHPRDGDQAYVVADRVARGREELSAWLRFGTFTHTARSHLGRLAELENLRLLAVAIHDDEAARELGAMVQGQRRGFMRREVLVPLAILEEMRMAGMGDSEMERQP
jgi:hypothetical protein